MREMQTPRGKSRGGVPTAQTFLFPFPCREVRVSIPLPLSMTPLDQNTLFLLLFCFVFPPPCMPQAEQCSASPVANCGHLLPQ